MKANNIMSFGSHSLFGCRIGLSFISTSGYPCSPISTWRGLIMIDPRAAVPSTCPLSAHFCRAIQKLPFATSGLDTH